MLEKLGKYQIRHELGRGAMGIVYEAFDPYIQRAVAIKTIQKSMLAQSEADEILGRFRREAQAAGRLSHPNIVSVYEYGEDGEVAYIAMEFIVGRELKEHFDKAKRYALNDSVDIMVQLLDALEYSHSRGVIHRDIKPSNILITEQGQAKIADFGIARIESSELTQVGTVLGTPSYMSPEQFMGLAADRRSDIYSAGVILYQFLTGERPFTGSNMTVIMHKVLNQPPVFPALSGAGLPQALHEVVEKAMAKRPEDRFQTAAEFIRQLKAATESPHPVRGGPSAEATRVSAPAQQSSGTGAVIDFNMADFEARLQELQHEVDRRSARAKPQDQPDDSLREVNLGFHKFISSQQEMENAATASAAKPVIPHAAAAAPEESGLLAGLAREAQAKQGSRQSAVQHGKARDKQVDEALNRLARFFNPFIKHANEAEPEINRSYRYDARTVYSGLKWRGATLETRKLSLSEAALTDFVDFSVMLCAPEPVLLKRPWGPFETLQKELQVLKLRVFDDLEAGSKKPRQEWLEARLAPDFPVQIRFQGDYAEGDIRVNCLNLGGFGVSACRLAPADATSAFLDDLGLFLLGRSDRLPVQLRRA